VIPSQEDHFAHWRAIKALRLAEKFRWINRDADLADSELAVNLSRAGQRALAEVIDVHPPSKATWDLVVDMLRVWEGKPPVGPTDPPAPSSAAPPPESDTQAPRRGGRVLRPGGNR